MVKSSLSGYVIQMPSGEYVKWHEGLRWSTVKDPMDASHFSQSDNAMFARPIVGDKRLGVVGLLRVAVRGHA